jgi:hypothetical protein
MAGAAFANQFGTGSKSGMWFNNPDNLSLIWQGYSDYKAGAIGIPLTSSY